MQFSGCKLIHFHDNIKLFIKLIQISAFQTNFARFYHQNVSASKKLEAISNDKVLVIDNNPLFVLFLHSIYNRKKKIQTAV